MSTLTATAVSCQQFLGMGLSTFPGRGLGFSCLHLTMGRSETRILEKFSWLDAVRPYSSRLVKDDGAIDKLNPFAAEAIRIRLVLCCELQS